MENNLLFELRKTNKFLQEISIKDFRDYGVIEELITLSKNLNDIFSIIKVKKIMKVKLNNGVIK